MKTVPRLYVMFFLAAALALPSGAFLVHHIFIIKDTAMGMLGEEHLADQRDCPSEAEELRRRFGVQGKRGGQPRYPLLISVEAPAHFFIANA